MSKITKLIKNTNKNRSKYSRKILNCKNMVTKMSLRKKTLRLNRKIT